ncbi:MAG: homocysteine S-methyltransferase family protein, partial [Pseudomonadales bacterium]|nr:homocysteine S-methyltransferase family protein [Pseudomonadales bacterium]
MTARSTHLLEAALRRRIHILDGAYGTQFQALHLEEEDFRGEAFAGHSSPVKGNHDLLCLTRPEAVAEAHREYLRAGADIIKTNSFTATRIAQADYRLEDRVAEMNRAAARIARSVADEFSTREHPRYVAGVLGPTNRTASLSPDVNDPGARNVTFAALAADYRDAAIALLEGGADLLLLETVFDTLNAKAAVFGIEEVFAEKGRRLPLMISGTITDLSGRTLSGQ